MTPDPVDALKYALVLVGNRLDGHDMEDVVDAVKAIAAPFLGGGPREDMRYSDGSRVTVNRRCASGRHLSVHHLPPGYPTGSAADQ